MAVSLAVEQGVAHLVLTRGDASNPFDDAFCAELLEAATSAVADPRVRCVLIRSEGRNFSYGGDLRWLASHGDRMHEAAARPVAFLNRTLAVLAAGEAPVVAAVQGMAAGGAVGLVAAADVVLAGESARFYAAFPGIGLSCDTGCSYFLPRLVGLRRAQAFLLLNETWDAATAQAAGLVTRCVADEALAQAARELAERLAAGPTLAFGQIRHLLQAERGLVEQLALEAAGIARTARSPDMPAAVHALLAKQIPVFAGR